MGSTGDRESTDTTTRPIAKNVSDELHAGQLFAGRFKLISKLGEGAFGQVWKAINTKLDLKIALKIPRTNAPDDLERFRREAQALCLIDSEYVLRCFEYNDDPVPFLVMELLTGESLAKRLEREGPLPMSAMKVICQQLCKGLQATHAAGVIHRDLKPGNVCCIKEKVKIVDFGLMKLLDRQAEPGTKIVMTEHQELTRENVAVGTIAYMSPEQLRHSNDVDIRSDVWSLCAMLYRLLSGKLPFTGASHMDIARRILLSEDPPPPIPDLPDEVNAFFRIAFQRDPNLRFQTAMDVYTAFESLPEGDRISVAPLPITPMFTRGRIAGLVAAGALSLLGVATVAQAQSESLPGCAPTHGNCDHSLLNGCEADLTSVESCGACGIQCLNSHGATSCVAGSCVPTCAEGYADCDGNAANGCEADLRSAEHCGQCAIACTNAHGSAACSRGACAPSCLPGFSDCDGNAANGCETDVLTSGDHCGSCGRSCTSIAANGATCREGACKIACEAGHHDCNGNPADGCEVDEKATPESVEGGRCGPILLASGDPGAFSIAVDDAVDGVVLWTVPTRGKLYRAGKSGGQASLVSSGGIPHRVVFDEGHWYWTDTIAMGIKTLDPERSTPVAWLSWPEPEWKIAGLAARGDGTFFVYDNARTNQRFLYSTKKENDKEPLAVDGQDVNSSVLAAGPENVYFTRTSDAGSIWAHPVKDNGASKKITDKQGKVTALAIDRREGFVVWAGERAAEKGAAGGYVAIARGEQVRMLASNEATPHSIAVDGAFAYWTNADGDVKKARLDGNAAPVVLASQQPRPMGIAVDALRVYWVNETSGEVAVVAK